MLGSVICTFESIEVVTLGVLAVQVFLEPPATTGPSVPPEGANDTKSLVKDCVYPNDKSENLLHNTLLF